MEKGLMRGPPRGQGSTLMVALIHPLQVVIALMDAFQRKVGSHQHLTLVHLHHQAEKVLRKNLLPFIKAHI